MLFYLFLCFVVIGLTCVLLRQSLSGEWRESAILIHSRLSYILPIAVGSLAVGYTVTLVSCVGSCKTQRHDWHEPKMSPNTEKCCHSL